MSFLTKLFCHIFHRAQFIDVHMVAFAHYYCALCGRYRPHLLGECDKCGKTPIG